jgi:hypothetical protein
MHAFAGFRQEQGPVQGALDQLAADVQELPRQPIQGGARVGAAVAIGEDLPGATHQETLYRSRRRRKREAAAARVRE